MVDLPHHFFGQGSNLYHFFLPLGQIQIVPGKFRSLIVNSDRHLSVPASDHLVLLHVGDGIFRGIVDDRVNTPLRVLHGAAQRLGKPQGIRHAPEHIAVHDHRLLVGSDNVRSRQVIDQKLLRHGVNGLHKGQFKA